ncbi:MAG: NADP-dependent oxidoreductase [Bacteroidota bacterium]
MKAIVRKKGGPALRHMEVQDLESPKPGKGEVRVSMKSARINPVDIDLMKGMPFIKYQKPQIGGVDGAGTIVELGPNVQGFAVGDTVFFYRAFTNLGSWAEEVVVPQDYLAKTPKNISVEQAGAIALPLLTAYESLQALEPQPGETILIHGAAGGVGLQATQLAKSMGLTIIGTAGPEDESILQKIGIDQWINYRTEDFQTSLAGKQVDYVFDTIGGEVLKKSIQLSPKKIVSVHYLNPEKMHKTGIRLPSVLRWIMKQSMNKYNRLAKKHQVQIIGQVTGPNGNHLQLATERVEALKFQVKSYRSLSLDQVEQTGLADVRPGTILTFNIE